MSGNEAHRLKMELNSQTDLFRRAHTDAQRAERLYALAQLHVSQQDCASRTAEPSSRIGGQKTAEA